jgi:hypothetical protein
MGYGADRLMLVRHRRRRFRPTFNVWAPCPCEHAARAEALTESGESEVHRLLIYGANGYTGRLIAREAVARSLPAVLGGRNAEAVSELARQCKLEHRIFALDDPSA